MWSFKKSKGISYVYILYVEEKFTSIFTRGVYKCDLYVSHKERHLAASLLCLEKPLKKCWITDVLKRNLENVNVRGFLLHGILT